MFLTSIPGSKAMVLGGVQCPVKKNYQGNPDIWMIKKSEQSLKWVYGPDKNIYNKSWGFYWLQAGLLSLYYLLSGLGIC